MSLQQEGPGSLAQNPGTPGSRSVATLSRDLADFLVEFSIVLHKRAMYPLGHPHLEDSTERFVNRVESLLAPREFLAIGVARHQLIVAGVATDPRNALLSDLARRLHRHRIATLRLDRGVSLNEVNELLGALAADPQAERGPFGLSPNAGASWSHVRIQPPELTRLFLQEEDEEDGDFATPGGALWLGLAHLALSAEGSATDSAEDPLLVARAIDAQPEHMAYDRVVLDYLSQIADEMSGRTDAWEPRVRERVSRLVSSLKPETLRRVLKAGADHTERRRFALTAAQVLAVDAVIEVVEAAAATTGQTISHQLLRLLHKFAHHAEQGPPQLRAEAESMLRRNVAQLITDWNLEDPNPGAYTEVLEGMVRRTPDAPEDLEDKLDCEPETVLQIGLETGCAGPRVQLAMEALLETRLPTAIELLHGAPAGSVMADAMWREIATPARLRLELSAPRQDFRTIERMVSRLGPTATEPLLDLLEQSADRSARARTLNLLASIGPSVAPAAAARLKNAPWFVQRNLLALLRLLHVWPPGFSAVTYACHPELRLRREAYKLLLEFPAQRPSAILHGLEDSDAEIVTLVLRAAVDGCPPEAMRAIERFVEDWRRPAPLRALAVRALARSHGPQALARLMELAGARRRFFGWRLEAKSPVVLAAVSALARYWGSHPQVASLLEMARRHSDPEIRTAAGMRHA
jgi:DNA-binding transcriptional MerR regulator